MSKILIGMDRIRAHPGLQAKIARALGITSGAVAKWKRIPANRVLALESLCGISRHDLRPDIYPPPFGSVEQRLASLPPRRKHKNASIGVA